MYISTIFVNCLKAEHLLQKVAVMLLKAEKGKRSKLVLDTAKNANSNVVSDHAPGDISSYFAICNIVETGIRIETSSLAVEVAGERLHRTGHAMDAAKTLEFEKTWF